MYASTTGDRYELFTDGTVEFGCAECGLLTGAMPYDPTNTHHRRVAQSRARRIAPHHTPHTNTIYAPHIEGRFPWPYIGTCACTIYALYAHPLYMRNDYMLYALYSYCPWL